mmetsp:Transcript_8402/g.23684  ORF Transcript_8402/g.23684 Transcript_8402/m.23684 type:complete len:567 (-) Transcript_8402:143-1843(-)
MDPHTSRDCDHCKAILTRAIQELISHHRQQELDAATLWSHREVEELLGHMVSQIRYLDLLPPAYAERFDNGGGGVVPGIRSAPGRVGGSASKKGKAEDAGAGDTCDGSAASAEDREKAEMIKAIVGDCLSVLDIMCILRHHEKSANIDAVMDTILQGVDMSEWWAKDKVLIQASVPEPSKDPIRTSDDVELRDSQRFGLTDEDVKRAKIVRSIVDRSKYTMNDILCVMRNHPQSQNTDAVIATFFEEPSMEDWHAKDAVLLRKSATPIEKDCLICWTEYPVTDMFTLDCEESHRYCFDCITRHAETALNGEGKAPTCPGCEHTFTMLEVEQVFGKGELLDKYNAIMLRMGLNSLGEGCIGCPTPDCTNYVVVSDPKLKTQCVCSGCRFDFCSLCREAYHYGPFTCQEVKALEMAWVEWQSKNRKQQVQQRMMELERRRIELERDEVWKEKNLRLCPKCGRGIEKTGGCSSMVCGRNADGGNIQDGCGHNFTWSQAKPYKRVRWDEHLKTNQGGSSSGDERWLCDRCRNDIKDTRLQCLHCRVFNLCIFCDERAKHNPAHVFAVIKM